MSMPTMLDVVSMRTKKTWRILLTQELPELRAIESHKEHGVSTAIEIVKRKSDYQWMKELGYKDEDIKNIFISTLMASMDQIRDEYSDLLDKLVNAPNPE